MANDDDMDLLRKWRAGDRQAGDALIRKHYGYALDLAKRRLVNEDDAVEATQNAMKVLVQKDDVLERVEKIEEERNGEKERRTRTSVTPFRAYLSKVVYYSVLTQTKRRRHERWEDDEPAARSARGASTMMSQREEVRLLVKAMRSLSIDDQLLLYYEYVGDKTRGELAELLDIPMTSIYTRIHKAKARARKKLEGFRDSPVRQSTLGGFETWLRSIHGRLPEAGLG